MKMPGQGGRTSSSDDSSSSPRRSPSPSSSEVSSLLAADDGATTETINTSPIPLALAKSPSKEDARENPEEHAEPSVVSDRMPSSRSNSSTPHPQPLPARAESSERVSDNCLPEKSEALGEEAEVSLPSSAFHSMVTGVTTSVARTNATGPKKERLQGSGGSASPERLAPFSGSHVATMVGRGGDMEEEKEESSSASDISLSQVQAECPPPAANGASCSDTAMAKEDDRSSLQSNRSCDAQVFTVLYGEEERRTGIELVEAEERRCRFRAFRAIIPLIEILQAEWRGATHVSRPALEYANGELPRQKEQTLLRSLLPREPFVTRSATASTTPMTRSAFTASTDVSVDWRDRSATDRTNAVHRSQLSSLVPNILTTGPQRQKSDRVVEKHRWSRLSDRDIVHQFGASMLAPSPQTVPRTWTSRFEDSVDSFTTRPSFITPHTSFASGAHKLWPSEVLTRGSATAASPRNHNAPHQQEEADSQKEHRSLPVPAGEGYERAGRNALSRQWNSSTNTHSLSAPSRFVDPLLPGTFDDETVLNWKKTAHERFTRYPQHSSSFEKANGAVEARDREAGKERKPWQRLSFSASDLRHAGWGGSGVESSAISVPDEPYTEGITPLPPPRLYRWPAAEQAADTSRASSSKRPRRRTYRQNQSLLAQLPRPVGLLEHRFQRLTALQLLLRGEVEQEWAEDLRVMASLHAARVTTVLERGDEPRVQQVLEDATVMQPHRWQELPPSPRKPSTATPAFGAETEDPADGSHSSTDSRSPSPSPTYHSAILHAAVNVNLRLVPDGDGGCPYPIRDGDRLTFINGNSVSSLDELQRWERETDWPTAANEEVTLVRRDGKLVLRVTGPPKDRRPVTKEKGTRRKKAHC